MKNLIFLCEKCGADFPKWHGRCPNCKEWDTLSEFKKPKNKKINSILLNNSVPKQINNFSKIGKNQRIKTNINELDRVLGGGFVNGSLILVGGDPGIGKSTLVLQSAYSSEILSLYISAEENEDQLSNRAKRLGVQSKEIFILNENNLEVILNHIENINPKLVIFDSIQTIYTNDSDSIPGSINQVRDCSQKILELCKKNKIIGIVIGHVTKEGVIAGPRILEHMVDTVLYIEGEKRNDFRILRSIKNRFGATNEIGVFEMYSNGLNEVKNPSNIFISERQLSEPGSSIFPSIEGSRPILIEIQALVTNSSFGTPQRNVTGFKLRRLSMLLAVLEKKLGFSLGGSDIFINVVGGLKIDEPAADLAVISSIISIKKNLPIKKDLILLGEVGLAGELRSVNNLEERLKESANLGFTQAIVPKRNSIKNFNKINLIRCDSVKDAFEKIFTKN